MVARAPVFDKILKDYLEQVAHLNDVVQTCAALGVRYEEDGYRVGFFDQQFTITAGGIVDETGSSPNHSTSVILCQYLLLCPDAPTDDRSLVTYKDFKDAAPYAGGFKNTAGRPIARQFEGQVEKLEQRCLALGGRSFDTDVLCQLAFQFRALPRVPIFLLFNDADEDFPSQCTLLFQKDAADYLDMECLAMVGSTLSHRLQAG